MKMTIRIYGTYVITLCPIGAVSLFDAFEPDLYASRGDHVRVEKLPVHNTVILREEMNLSPSSVMN